LRRSTPCDEQKCNPHTAQFRIPFPISHWVND
jgi:hypothetical protein